MPRTREHSEPTRQLYASIREDIYLAAKSRAAQLRLPLRRFIEDALVNAIDGDSSISRESLNEQEANPIKPRTVWDDQYIGAQASQPLGSPLDLSENEARRVALEGFISLNESAGDSHSSGEQHVGIKVQGRLGDPVDLSDEDAAEYARQALAFGESPSREMIDG